MAKKMKRSAKRAWTKNDFRTLKSHSKAKTSVVEMAKLMKRSPGALRQQAMILGIPLGHRR